MNKPNILLQTNNKYNKMEINNSLLSIKKALDEAIVEINSLKATLIKYENKEK